MPKCEVPQMVNMYEVVDYLCRKNRISIAQMCRDIGLRQGLISDLKHGRTKNLSYENMVKIANYFQISVDVFNEGVLEETLPNECDARNIAGYHYLLKEKFSNDIAPDEEILAVLQEFRENPELRTLFSLTKNATPEELRQYSNVIKALRGGGTSE